MVSDTRELCVCVNAGENREGRKRRWRRKPRDGGVSLFSHTRFSGNVLFYCCFLVLQSASRVVEQTTRVLVDLLHFSGWG